MRLIRSGAGLDAAPAYALVCCSADTGRRWTQADRRTVACDSSNIAVVSDATGNAACSVTVEHAEEIAAVADDEADEAVNELNWFAVAVGGEDEVADEDDSDAIGDDDLDDRSWLGSVCQVQMEGRRDWCLCSAADCGLADGSRSQASPRSANLLREHLHCLRLNYSNYSPAKASRLTCCRSAKPHCTDLDIRWQSPEANYWRCPDSNDPSRTS